MRRTVLAAGLMGGGLLIILAGCRAMLGLPAGPMPAPRVVTNVSYFSGSPLKGPSAGSTIPENLEGALNVHVTITALEELPEERFKPLEAFVYLVAASRGGKAIRPTGILTHESRMAFPEDTEKLILRIDKGDLGRSAAMASLSGVLPVNVTAKFSMEAEDPKMHPVFNELVSERIEIQVYRKSLEIGQEGIEVALVLQDLITPLEDEDAFDFFDVKEEDEQQEENKETDSSPEDMPPVLHREFVVLDPQQGPEGEQLALFLPSPFSGEARSLAVVIQIGPAPEGPFEDEAGRAKEIARCRAELEKVAQETEDRGDGNPVDRDFWPGVDDVMKGLSRPEMQRAALVFLAHATEARLAEDIALSAPAEIIKAMAEGLHEKVLQDQIRDIAVLAWIVEMRAFQLVVDLMANEEMTPVLEGMLARRAGEAGRNESLLEDVIEQSWSIENLEENLLQVNTYFLEDSSPASRIRAFDWLILRGEAPAGYDPLAPLEARRAALAANLEKSEEKEEP